MSRAALRRVAMSLLAPAVAESGRKLIYGVSARALVVSIGLGVLPKNAWLPRPNHLRKRDWITVDFAISILAKVRQPA